MRIWVQSGTPLAASDLYQPYFESLQRHAKRVCRPDTVCEFPSLGKAYPGAARSRTHLHFVAHETMKSAMRAEAEGFDAFVTQCLDLGFNELRELIKIPVVFMTQSTLAYYSLLAPNFAFLVNNERLHYFFQEIAERYKVKERMVPGGYVSFAFTDYANLWNSPQPFIEAFMKVAKEVAGRGAASL
jgi:Asp/Glu/hydantoin racemase